MVSFIHAVLLLIPAMATANKCFEGKEVVTAVCNLGPRGSDENGIVGKVDILQVSNSKDDEVSTYFKIKITGLEPNTAHGFHIHKSGDIFGQQGCKGAGGHYNPFNQTHGAQRDVKRHVGDLGNVYADKNGIVMVIKKDQLDLLTGTNSIVGRAIVLHAKKDDLGRGGDVGSETTGNAGGRIACGIIVTT